MTIQDAAKRMIDALTSSGVPYMLVGSLSSSNYGIPRSTRDADFVVESFPYPLEKLTGLLRPELVLDRQMSFETVTATTRYQFNLAGTVFKIELFSLSDDPHDRERFRRRVQRTVFDRPVWLPTAEDVIITKLRWSKQGKRSKDIEDVRNVIAVQGNKLDFDYVLRWCEEHGTRDLLNQIRQSIPTSLTKPD